MDKSLGETKPNPNPPNGILRNATIAVPLKNLSNFWRSFELPLINCKNLNGQSIVFCLQNADDNDNVINIIFIIEDTKLYDPVVNLSARDNQKLSKLLSKGFERSVYWNKQ